ncbi:YqhR family membrane protein [Virgibacillus natechei]|uniref:YqhR family membrane protein n=1 Tax=Virgibacillus sp. CBA3643 TaxID=2942278 RepID=UPI0035A37AFD
MSEEKENQQLEQRKNEDPGSILSRSLLTGFIGGILWGAIGVIMYYFNFSEVTLKTYLLRSWTTAAWTDTWLGDVVSILLVSVISTMIAFIYHGLFKKIKSMWFGVAYGIILWGIVFYVIQPIFENVPPITDLNANTVISTLCLYVLYGTFVGYSISFDYHDTKLIKARRQANN